MKHNTVKKGKLIHLIFTIHPFPHNQPLSTLLVVVSCSGGRGIETLRGRRLLLITMSYKNTKNLKIIIAGEMNLRKLCTNNSSSWEPRECHDNKPGLGRANDLTKVLCFFAFLTKFFLWVCEGGKQWFVRKSMLRRSLRLWFNSDYCHFNTRPLKSSIK